jgi:molybdopterin-guanine dinucleotide biosynthesis protein A
MGGRTKGLLLARDGRMLVERLRDIVGPFADVVLVGEAGAYEALDLEAIADEPEGIGPLGGLLALLRRAGGGTVLAVACDMPFVSSRVVEGLLAAGEAGVVAPRLNDRWEPLCARYDAARVLPVAAEHARLGQTSLQRLLDALGAMPLPEAAYDPRELRDWDEPEDMVAD